MDVGEVDINGSNWPLLEADVPPWPVESGKSGGPACEGLTETIQGEGLKPVHGEINGSIGEVGNLRISADILTMADCGPEALRTILVREGRIEAAADPSPGSPPSERARGLCLRRRKGGVRTSRGRSPQHRRRKLCGKCEEARSNYE